MIIDHYAYRVKDRGKAVEFLGSFIGYLDSAYFEIPLEDGSMAFSTALKKDGEPDVFVSSGPPGSLIDKWVKDNNGGGVHHIAYAVHSVKATMDDWKSKGIEFTTDEPIVGEYLTQAFTKENPLTGIIYELIEREDGVLGFELENVKKLMESTRGL